MGRKKIKIAPLPSRRARSVTLKKRQPGLIKKGYELSVLCDLDVFMFFRDKASGDTTIFTSTGEDYVPNYDKVGPQGRIHARDFFAVRHEEATWLQKLLFGSIKEKDRQVQEPPTSSATQPLKLSHNSHSWNSIHDSIMGVLLTHRSASEAVMSYLNSL